MPMRHNLKSKVPFKYLIMHFTAIQCGGPAFDMNWLTIFIANAILVLIATVAKMIDSIPTLYGTTFISLCTILNSSFKSFNNFEFALSKILTGLHSSVLKHLNKSLI